MNVPGISIATLSTKFQEFAELDAGCIVRFTLSEGVHIDFKLTKANELLGAVDAQTRTPGQEMAVDVQLGGYMLNLMARPVSNNAMTLFGRYG